MANLADLSAGIFANLLDLPQENRSKNNPVEKYLAEQSSARLEVLLLIDGLGANQIPALAEKFPIFASATKNLPLHSIFPSTTVVNLTSLATGLLPNEHGMLGYTMRVPYSGNPERLLNGLKWDEKIDPQVWQDQPTLFEKASSAGVQILHIAAKRYEGSGFTRAALRGGTYIGVNRLPAMAEVTIAEFEKSKTRNIPTFAYLYLNNLDAAGHKFGLYSNEWWEAAGEVSEFILELVNKLPKGVRFWVTADHGMINSANYLELADALLSDIKLIGGEPRARHLYFAPDLELGTAQYDDCLARNMETLKNHFGESAQVLSRQEARTELFAGQMQSEKEMRIGDLVVIPNADYLLIDPARSKEEKSMVGHHGGLSKSEMEITALVWEK